MSKRSNKSILERMDKEAWWQDNFDQSDFQRLAKKEREQGMFALTPFERERLVYYMDQLERRNAAIKALRRA